MIRKINGIDLRPFTDATTHTVGLTTTNTKTASILIPGGTFVEGDVFDVEAMFFKSNTNGTFTTRLYYNTSDSLTGASQLGIRNTTNNTILYQHFYRRFSIRNSSGSGSGIELGTECYRTTTSQANDLEVGILALSNVAIDWTSDVYLIFAVQLSATLTSVSQRFAKVWTY
jgi:hypothetical protein